MQVLVIDDYTPLRNELIAILLRNGIEADGASSAQEAIPLVEQGHYDFVLVDYQMPEHDGLWFMQTVKRPAATKVLLITAQVDRDNIDNMFKAGVSGYIIKPFDEEDLLHHLGFHANKGAPQANGKTLAPPAAMPPQQDAPPPEQADLADRSCIPCQGGISPLKGP